MPPVNPIDLTHVRAQLAGPGKGQYWRSLEDAGQTAEFRAGLDAEFGAPVPAGLDGVSRRDFLRLMGASMALAGVVGCTRQPIEAIVPYVKQPEEVVPGQPLFCATAHERDGFATGLLVESHEGHPTKIEGNPEHPASRGTTSIFDQAAILDLYDPERAQTVTQAGGISTWGAFLSAISSALQAQQSGQGAGLRVLTGTVTSPTLAAQLEALLAKFPKAQWHQFQPISRDNVRESARLAFGEIVEAHYHFETAKVVLSLDADFLFTHPDRLRLAREFVDARRLSAGQQDMNRLYVAESTPTITGTMADHRLPLLSGDVENVAREIARRVGAEATAPGTALAGDVAGWVDLVAADLRLNQGAGIVIAGERQPPAVHALAHRMNHALGNAGKTVTYSASVEARPVLQLGSFRQLAGEMEAGQVEILVILGGNPVFAAPADLSFAEHLAKVKMVVHLGEDFNETSTHAHWHIPQTHFLETWSDSRAFDGTTSIVQPLIQPLYESHSAHEVLEAMLQQPVRGSYEIVREHWQRRNIWPDFEASWRKALHDGLIANTALPHKEVRPVAHSSETLASDPSDLSAAGHSLPGHASGLEITFHPDPCVWDGRYANNGWLQELAAPISKLTWDNAALVSPALAQSRQLANGDLVELRFSGHTVRAPIWIMPGQAENSVAVQLGRGRTHAGRVGAGAGFNAYLLRTAEAQWFSGGLEIVRTGGKYPLSTTQNNHTVTGRDILFTGTLPQYRTNPAFAHAMAAEEGAVEPKKGDTLYNAKEHEYDGYRWGMAIDLNACIGCNACVIACQSENNIPVVGKEQIGLGRDMAWIRIDSYFRGGLDNPEVSHMPVPCMQCENAPCELVCPVAATVHDHEGLNVQVYNRCVGTRYCSNNCPYKVRRFNFLQYADYHTPALKPMRNPNVTVRWRGVMEKCTYCVQRISAARIDAKKRDGKIGDGQVLTACQQACPTQAIVFGDLSDPASRVSRMKAQPLNYAMLGVLNTRPRTTYLAKVRNPNLEMERRAHA